MKKHLLLLLPTLLLGIIVFVISCVRNRDSYWDSPDLKSARPLTVADAQKWFEKEYKDEITMAKSAADGKSTRMVSYAEGVFAGVPEWNETHAFRKYSNSLISTLDYTDLKTRYRGFRDLIIVRNHKTKTFNAVVQLQLFDTAYLNSQIQLKGPQEHIRSYSDPATFTGKMYLYSVKNEFIRGAVYKNGKMVARLFPKNKISSFLKSFGTSKAKQTYVPFNGGADLGRAPSEKVSKSVTIQPGSAARSYEERPPVMAFSGGDSTDTDEYDTNDPDSNMQTVVVTGVRDTDTDTDTGTGSDDGCGDCGWGDPNPTDPCNCGGGGGGGGSSGPGTPPPPSIAKLCLNKNYNMTQIGNSYNIRFTSIPMEFRYIGSSGQPEQIIRPTFFDVCVTVPIGPLSGSSLEASRIFNAAFNRSLDAVRDNLNLGLTAPTALAIYEDMLKTVRTQINYGVSGSKFTPTAQCSGVASADVSWCWP
ncbi:hypothetical protein [Niabella beijingensis]|uniref:hypothetical protein n=1 Tax=Niabella beijingensis TaxID=2872700 RepID=UPI0023E36226|nr:hypothetical protein [Niabella beijingensis]